MRYLIRSFRYAFEGLTIFYKKEPKAWIHTLAAGLAITFGGLVDLRTTEWFFLILAIALVFMAELFNTAVEVLADRVHPEQHPEIKAVKDLSAAAVLIAALFAIFVGLYLLYQQWPML